MLARPPSQVLLVYASLLNYAAAWVPFRVHALSLPTWWIHITSVLEWIAAILMITLLADRRNEPEWRWLALAMLPALGSAMAACTWHLFDNPASLQWLVTLQAALTLAGNGCLAWAARRLLSTGSPDR